jgi:hypothetical protein
MGFDAVIETARHAVNAAGWSLYELTAEQVEGQPLPLRDTGFLILSDVVAPIAPAVANLVAAFQHLVRRGLPVGLLVGTIEGIASLRKDPALGFLDRAESVLQDE